MYANFILARHFHNIAAVAGREPCQSSEQKQHLLVPSFWRMFLLSMPEWKYAAIGCFNAFIVGGIQPFSAFTMGSLTSTYFLRDQNEIKKKTTIHSLIFLFISIFSFLTNIGQHYSFGVTGEYLTKQVRHLMLSKMLAFEVGWFDQEENSPGAIYSQFANDTYMVKSLVGDRMSLLIQTFSAIMIAFTMGLIIAWRLALVMITTQPIVILCFYYRKALLKSMSKDAVKGQSESSKVAAEAISNLRTVTAFSSQDRILRLFDLAQQGFYHQSMCQSWLAGIVLGLSQCLMRCTFALALWYGSRLTVHGYITPKSLFQTYLILVTTGRVIADAGSMTTDLAKGTDAISSIFSMLDRVSQIEPEDSNGSRPEKVSGKLEFLNVDFEYPARPNVIVLKGFSLLIEAGKSTALVGKSGSGKSTIIGLIERFYDPYQGEIKIDGRDIKSYHLRSLRRHIALVEQEPMLFSGSIKENVAYGIEGVMETEVEEAARAANAHDFICRLKDGYDTLCGDRGVQLSGGQKQRIAIARAILKRPTILLLDEATSALDSESEKKVKEALERVMDRRTSIIVAHRLSTIQNCDLIAVLDKGVMVEEGNHRSLLDKGPSGFYYRLLKLQQNTKECI
ncbi:putative multidrug resistance protein [Asparagus officinalis]|nr:putative multidrug resistance protein [Asparagus officinalis]